MYTLGEKASADLFDLTFKNLHGDIGADIVEDDDVFTDAVQDLRTGERQLEVLLDGFAYPL